MELNLKNCWVLILSIILGSGSYVLGMCGVTRACFAYADLNKYSFILFEPILLYSITALPLGFALIFVRDDIFGRWLRFAQWWVPLSIVLITLAPTSSNVWMPLFPDPTKEGLSWLMGGLFTIASLTLIIRKSRAPRKG